MLVAVPLFLLTPRLEGPDWEPLARMGNRRTRTVGARTGFSDEIDLRRIGTLTNDDALAFTVRMTDPDGDPRGSCPATSAGAARCWTATRTACGGAN